MKKALLMFSLFLILSSVSIAYANQSSVHSQPYAGLQDRTIKALSPEKIKDLLNGKGSGYALAAELNHYPGPAHAIELSDALKLTDDQKTAISEFIPVMKEEAKQLGKQLIDLEKELEHQFRNGKITEQEMLRLTNEIAVIEGKIRFTHLVYHLKTKELLTPEQVYQYDELRGYTTQTEIEHKDKTTYAVVVNDRPFAPIRNIAEQLGATVEWDVKTRQIKIYREKLSAVIQIASNIVIKNGETSQMENAALLRNGTTIVPIDYLKEIFNLEVDWNEQTNVIRILHH